MRLRRSFFAASVVAAAFVCTALAASAAPLASPTNTPTAGPWSLAPGEYYTDITASTFTTNSYFDADGHRVLSPITIQQRVGSWNTELGWNKRWSVQLSLPMVSSAGRAGTDLSDVRSGFGDFGFGLRMKLKNGPSATALQLRWEAPTGYNAKLDMAPGDGLQKLSASLQFGGAQGKQAFWQLGAGYRYDFLTIGSRNKATASDGYVAGDQDWSDHVTLNAAYARWFGRLQVAGLYGGDLPIDTGRYNFATGQTYKVAMHAAGPRFTYRVDERLDAFAGSWHTPVGKNAWHLDEYYVGFAFKNTKLNRQQGFLGNDSRP